MSLQRSSNFNFQTMGIIISISIIIFLIFDGPAVDGVAGVDKTKLASASAFVTSEGPCPSKSDITGIYLRKPHLQFQGKSKKTRGSDQITHQANFDLTSCEKRIHNRAELNITKFATKEVIFFNRVPKAGSQSMRALVQRLVKRNLFRHVPYPTNRLWNIMHNSRQERSIAVKIQKFPPPVLYSMHTPFVNFTRHDYPMPIYINMVRDPIERIISWFHYARIPPLENKKPIVATPRTRDWLNKDFEHCVLNGDPECSFIPGKFHHSVNSYYRSQALFFCGEHKKCFEFNGKWAIQKAKKNVEQYYAVVGVLEEMHLTVKVLENYIPRFFAGATQLYSENEAEFKNIHRNFEKPQISEDIKNMLRNNFTLEIDFYEFCKQRLYSQHAALLQCKQ